MPQDIQNELKCIFFLAIHTQYVSIFEGGWHQQAQRMVGHVVWRTSVPFRGKESRLPLEQESRVTQTYIPLTLIIYSLDSLPGQENNFWKKLNSIFLLVRESFGQVISVLINAEILMNPCQINTKLSVDETAYNNYCSLKKWCLALFFSSPSSWCENVSY